MNILIYTNRDTYDHDLEDELSDLDIDLVKTFPWLLAEVMQIPALVNEDQAHFESAVTVYAK